MPSERTPFTLPVEPISPPSKSVSVFPHTQILVEAPGTAPGSEELISKPFIAIAGEPAVRI